MPGGGVPPCVAPPWLRAAPQPAARTSAAINDLYMVCLVGDGMRAARDQLSTQVGSICWPFFFAQGFAGILGLGAGGAATGTAGLATGSTSIGLNWMGSFTVTLGVRMPQALAPLSLTDSV